MNKTTYIEKIKFLAFLIAFLTVTVSQSFAANRYLVATGNWNSTSVWSTSATGGGGATVPGPGDVAFIQRGNTVTVTANATVGSLNFSTNTTGNLGTLTIATGKTLTVNGATTLYNASATVNASINGSGTLTTSQLNIGNNPNPGTNGTYTHTLVITNTNINVSGDLKIISERGNNNSRLSNGVLSINSGTVTVNGSVITVNENGVNTATLTLGNSSPTLRLNGATPFTISGTGTSNITLNGTGATVIYGSTGNQTVRQTTYTNLTVSGSGTKTLNGGTTVTGILTLTNGVLSTTTDNLLSITNTATSAITGGSATAYINGPVRWTLPASLTSGSTYVFPVGKSGNYKPFSLVNPTTGTGTPTPTVQVEAFATGSGGSVDATLESISTEDYWLLTKTENLTNTSVSLGRTTAIAPMNSIASSTSVNGEYTARNGTVGVNEITNSATIPITGNTSWYFVLGRVIPKITVSTTNLTGFTYAENNGPSTEQSFTVGGTLLTSNITVLPTDTFEISLSSGASFAAQSIITLNVVNSTVATTTIYVRMKAGLAVGTIAPVHTISCSSTNATTKTISCSGTVTTAPVITATPASLTGFDYAFAAGPSVQKSFTVSGTNLIGNITVTPSTNYQISTTSGSGFASTALTVASGTVIYVRLKAGLGVGIWSENIVLTSTSANPVNVSCSGNVVASPTILNSISALSAFIYTFNAGPSGEQSFTVSASNLSANLVITPPANFQISTASGSGFQSTAITLTQLGGNVNTTTIYVRLKAGLAVNSYGPENITLSSSGASGKAVSCKGSVVSGPAIATSTLTLTGFGYKQYSATDGGTGVANGGPSRDQTFVVSGTSLGSNVVTVTAPANYEISQTSGGTFVNAITLTPSSGKVNSIIYVRLKSSLLAGDKNGNITVACSGLTTINVACVGKVFATPLITATSDGGTYCPGSTINLASTGGDIQSRYWQGPNNFYSTSQNPQLTTNATTALSGTYTVTGNVVVGGNLVTNGDFEAGNTSFGSSYRDTVEVSGSTQELWKEGYYAVVANPHSVHTNFSTNGDHTSGTGLQMVINGYPTAGVVIWSQSVPVIPGANYQFTYWVQTVVAENPSQLQLYVNGVAAGPIYTASASINTWTQFLYNASSGTNTLLNLELINQNTVASGNDFALDDIVFQQVLSSTASTDISVTPTVPVSVSIAASANPVTQGATVTFTAAPTNGGATPAYAWYVNNVLVSGASASTYSYVPANGDVVKCVLESSISCATNNPATSNTLTMTVNSSVNYWRGTNSTDWGTASNWTAGYVPAPGHDVVYASTTNSWGSNAINDLVLDQDRTIGSLINATSNRLVIPAGRTLIANNTVTTNGKNSDLIYIHSSSSVATGSLIYHNPASSPVYATVEMYSKSSWDVNKTNPKQRYKWQYFGIPVDTIKANPTFYGAYVRERNEAGNDTLTHWQSLTNESNVIPFKGYELCYETPRLISFKGKLVNRNFNSGPLTKTTSGGVLYPGQYIFANPYTAAIDILQLGLGSNMEQQIYLYNTGTFEQWNAVKDSSQIGNAPGQYTVVPKGLAGTNLIPRQLPSMGSMLVRVADPTPNAYVSINYNSVAMGNTDMQRMPSEQMRYQGMSTRFDIVGKTSTDRMWLVPDEKFTRSYDDGYDGEKIPGSALDPQIYAIEEDGNYQVGAIDELNNTTLAFQAGQDTEYKMTVVHENAEGKYSKIYLVDIVANVVADITESGTEYLFTAVTTAKPVNRFKIIANSASDEAINPTHIKVFSMNNNICVYNDTKLEARISVFDLAGRNCGYKTVGSNEIITFPVQLQQTYIVRAVTEVLSESTKIIIR